MKAGEILLRVPARLAITDADKDGPPPPYPGAPWSLTLASRLLSLREGAAGSAWEPYLEVLPRNAPSPWLDVTWEALQIVQYPPARAELDRLGWIVHEGIAAARAQGASWSTADFHWALGVRPVWGGLACCVETIMGAGVLFCAWIDVAHHAQNARPRNSPPLHHPPPPFTPCLRGAAGAFPDVWLCWKAGRGGRPHAGSPCRHDQPRRGRNARELEPRSRARLQGQREVQGGAWGAGGFPILRCASD